MTDTKLQLDKLTATSWATWKFQTRIYLNANNLWNIVTGDEPRPDEENAPQEVADWDKRERMP